MSINTGGIVFKPQFGLSDAEVLKLMACYPARRLPSVTVERATSSSFDRLAVLNLTPRGTHADAPPPRSYEHRCTVWIFSPKLPLLCNFDATSSPVDDRLGFMSGFGDVLCYRLDGISDTYAWSLFQNKRRTCVRLVAPPQPPIAVGAAPTTWTEPPLTESGMLDLLERFAGDRLGTLLERRAHAYELAN